MTEKPAGSPEPPWDATRTWQSLVRLFGFGDRLDFVFLESGSSETFRAWRDALRAHCRATERPWSEPSPSQKILDWLEAERLRGLDLERAAAAQRPREIYLGTIAQDEDERFVFARINENRDNLVRALNGVLCLAGTGDFVRRLAYAAPSVWAMRTKSFELCGPPPAEVAAASSTAERGLESLVVKTAKESFDFDVLLTAGGHEESAARELRSRLEAEGFRCRVAVDESGLADLERARVVVVLLSPTYAYSSSWEALRGSRLAASRPDDLRARLLPILIGDAVIPGMFQGLTPLDFRSPESRARDYGRLVRALRGERDASEGPGLTQVIPVSSGDTSWLDQVPFPWVHPAARALLDALNAAYPHAEEMLFVLRAAGILTNQAVVPASTTDLWRWALELAARQHRVRSLLHRVLADDDVSAYHPPIRRLIEEPSAA